LVKFESRKQRQHFNQSNVTRLTPFSNYSYKNWRWWM